MPLDNELYIGTFAGGVGGMAKVSSLGEGVYSHAISEGAFTVDPVTYSRTAQQADGGVRQLGWLQTAWHISGLRAEQYDAIIAYKTDTTTLLYIHTLGEDGATYVTYLAKAIFPVIVNRGEPTAVEKGPVLDFEIRFIQLLEQE